MIISAQDSHLNEQKRKNNVYESFDGGDNKVLLLKSSSEKLKSVYRFIEEYKYLFSKFVTMICIEDREIQGTIDTTILKNTRFPYNQIPVGYYNDSIGDFSLQESNSFCEEQLDNKKAICVQNFSNDQQVKDIKRLTMEGEKVYPIIPPELTDTVYTNNNELIPLGTYKKSNGQVETSSILPRYILDLSNNDYNLKAITQLLTNSYRARCMQGIKIDTNKKPETLAAEIQDLQKILLDYYVQKVA